MPIELDATEASPRDPSPRDPTPLDRTATVAGGPRARADAASQVGPGTRLAHYRIERKLGEGGMGQVWLATDLALDRPVAIKLLLAGGDADRRDRLIREARAQARLIHQHVCHIYFIGEEDGQVFFAMEYVEGETLARRLERGPLPPDQALELARMAAQGLRAADDAGFTHRDVKPSNLMIDRHGVLKVMDFGLVSAAASELEAAGADGDAPVAASALVGTPLYMAPEQGRGEVVDRRADIYALGATLHHMISGAPPFVGETAAELLSRHESGARPRLTITPVVRRTATLADDVVARMMAKRAADRFPTYQALLDAIDQASTSRTRPAGMAVRAVANFIDVLLYALLAVPLMVLFETEDNNVQVIAVGLLAYPATIARWGTTPGRALFDLEIIPYRGRGKVGFFQAELRLLASVGPILVGKGIGDLGRFFELEWLHTLGEIVVFVGVAYGVIEVMRVSWRSVDKRTMWDRVAGTRVCYRRTKEPA